MPRCLLNLLSHVVVDLHVKDVGHKVQRILIVLDLRIQAGQVEAIREIVFVNLAEVFIASGRDELVRC